MQIGRGPSERPVTERDMEAIQTERPQPEHGDGHGQIVENSAASVSSEKCEKSETRRRAMLWCVKRRNYNPDDMSRLSQKHQTAKAGGAGSESVYKGTSRVWDI